MFPHSRYRQLKKGMKFKTGKDGFSVDEEDRAIINVGAENYDDIFSSYCYKGGDSLAPDLVNYLEEKAEGIPLDYDLIIRFHVKGASEAKREEVKEAVRINFENDIHAIKRQMQRNNWFALMSFLIGMSLFITFIFVNSLVPKIVSGILELFSWVLTWEALDAFFLDRRSLQLERLKKYRLRAAKIEIIEFENY